MANTEQLSVDELQQRLEEKAQLEKVNEKIFSSLDQEEILHTIIVGSNQLLSTERTTVFVVDFDKDGKPSELHTQAMQERELTEIRIPAAEKSFAGYVALHGETLNIKDVYDDATVAKINKNLRFDKSWDQKSGFRTRNMLAVPIKFESRTIGVLQCINRKDGEFKPHQVELAEKFAQFCGIALNNVQNHQKALSKLKKKQSLGDLLVQNGVVKPDVIAKAQEEAGGRQSKLVDLLTNKHDVPDSEIAKCVAELNSLEYLPFKEDMILNKDLVVKLTSQFCNKNGVVPYKLVDSAGKPALVLIMTDPKDFYTVDTVEMRTGYKVKQIHVSTPREISMILQLAMTGKKSDTPNQDLSSLVDEVAAMTGGEEEKKEDVETVDVAEGVSEQEGPIVKLANSIIEEAYRRGASDIHIEPFEKYVMVRYRKDGTLEKVLTFPRHARKAVVSRLKIMAEMNITERRLPQDGRIKFKDCGGKYNIELRVNSIPTVGEENEDVVMRILADSKPIPLVQSGMLERVYKRFMQQIDKPYGMILVVGPTGSGKTTTLHSAVGTINTPDMKILTAENPVEITQPGLRQVQIKANIGLDFKAALRAFLRQDPDVILVGEMRDLETCAIAVEAALTGHMLFSTLHTNNAPETITRMVDIGIDPITLTDALLCVLAQRLVKRLCPDCKEPYQPEAEELMNEVNMRRNADGTFLLNGTNYKLEDVRLYKPKGCPKCDNKGYRGRLAVHELLTVDDEMKRMLYSKAKVGEIRDAAVRSGMITLLNDGMEKALMGLTTPIEVRRACSE